MYLSDKGIDRVTSAASGCKMLCLTSGECHRCTRCVSECKMLSTCSTSAATTHAALATSAPPAQSGPGSGMAGPGIDGPGPQHVPEGSWGDKRNGCGECVCHSPPQVSSAQLG